MTQNVQLSYGPARDGRVPPRASSGRRGEDLRDPIRRTARTAGFLYLVMGVATAFGMGYVDPLLRAVPIGGAAADMIRSSKPLFLAGCASTVLGLVAMLFLANALVELLDREDRGQARLLVLLVGVGVAISLLNMGNALVAIGLSQEDTLPVPFDALQRQALIATFLRAYRCGGGLATLFWGLWMLPFGQLLFRSGFAPRALGVLMAVGSIPYLAHGVVVLFFPAYAAVTQRTLMMPTVAEVWAIGWLLARGFATVGPSLPEGASE